MSHRTPRPVRSRSLSTLALLFLSAVMSAVALVTGAGGGSVATREPGSTTGFVLPASDPVRNQPCRFVSRSMTTVHGSKSIMGGPGT
jgi:hypothetical protein